MAHTIDARRRAARVALVLAAMLAFAALRAPYVSVPLERDQGEYAYIAQRWLAGDVPYRDAFDQKPPAVFAVYALTFATLGESVEAIHGFLYLWTAGTALLLYWLVRRLSGELAASFALLAFAVASADARILAHAANTEIFLLLPLTGSVLCLVRALERGSGRWWIACGALAAAACWFKQVAAANVVFLGLAAAVGMRAQPRAIARAWGGLAVGGIVASLPVVLYFASRGAWSEFVDAVFLHNVRYSARLGILDGVARLLQALRFQAPSFWMLWALALPALVAPSLAGRRSWAVLAGWAFASAVAVSLGLYFRPHYFVTALPALCALVGVTLGVSAERLLARPSPALAGLGIAVAAALVVAPAVAGNRRTLFADSPDIISRRIYGLNPFPEARRIAEYIRRTSGEDESVFVVGSEPEIPFYAGRPSATRYIFFYPLTASLPGALERQQEVMGELLARPPRYVVWVHIPTSLKLEPGTEPYLFEEVKKLVAREYGLELLAEAERNQGPFRFRHAGEGAAARYREIADDGSAMWIGVFRRDTARMR